LKEVDKDEAVDGATTLQVEKETFFENKATSSEEEEEDDDDDEEEEALGSKKVTRAFPSSKADDDDEDDENDAEIGLEAADKEAIGTGMDEIALRTGVRGILVVKKELEDGF